MQEELKQPAISPHQIGRRPVQREDEDFLFQVYACSRDDVQRVPWTAEQKIFFLRGQSQAQRAHYQLHWPDSVHEVILVDGRPAGRLWVNFGEDELRLLDIVLLPEFRGHGIGTRFVRDLQQQAAKRGFRLALSALREHPGVIAWYRRLGFELREGDEIYVQMTWKTS